MIGLLGQPELKEKLALSRLEQLRQRIAVFYHLVSLDIEDTKKYVRHRLRIASASNREFFTEKALNLVYEFSNGIPRLINQICDSALLSGYIYGLDVIDEKLMSEVIAESPMMQIAGQKKIIRKLDEAEKTKLNQDAMNANVS